MRKYIKDGVDSERRITITIRNIRIVDLVGLRNAISDLGKYHKDGQLKFLEAIIDDLSVEDLGCFRNITMNEVEIKV